MNGTTKIEVAPLKKFTKLDKTPPVNLEFQDLNYFVQVGRGKLAIKQILKSVSGNFCSGELTGILGGSGSGKTTLINILAGYVLKGSQGSIKINGKARQMKVFRKLSTYIMQEDLIQPFLTVSEEITIATKLKLGKTVNSHEKQLIIDEVLNLLGLTNCLHTRVEKLSGGERRRLSIALELVSNPPVIFLDEPTSGLDSVAIKQVIDVLRTLTGEGRTVICTIHQPSVAVMQQFHQVYFLANGMCVYNGSPSNMLQFLNSVQLECPTTYSHSEFLIETVEMNTDTIPIISKAINNGKINIKDNLTKNKIVCVQPTEAPLNLSFSTTFWDQFCILFYRMMLQQTRNRVALCIQLLHHLFCGLMMGTLYYGTGNSASHAFSIFQLCLCVGMFYLYTYVMVPIVLFPAEVKILKREYFNLWYGLKPYYLALSLRTLPTMISLGLLFNLIVYTMTGQPLEVHRFLCTFLVCILVSMTSEGLGLSIGSVFRITNGAVFGPAIVSPMVFLAVYALDFNDTITTTMKFIRGTSYVRNGLTALVIAIFRNRQRFECTDEIYCHYQYPNQLLKDVGMNTTSYNSEIYALLGFLVLFRATTFVALRFRLNPELFSGLTNFILKITRQKKKTTKF